MQLGDIGRFLAQLPIADWVRTAENTLKQLGLLLSLLFVCFLIVWFFPGSFSADQRFAIIKGIGGLALINVAAIFVLSMWPGDRLYSPQERALQRLRYGTNRKPLPRRKALDEPASAPPVTLTEGAGEQEPGC